MLWPVVSVCESYRAVLEEPAPDLKREAPPGTTGHLGVNYSRVDQSRKVGTDCGQMTAVCKPCRGQMNVVIMSRNNQSDYSSIDTQMFALTSIESSGDYLVLHGVAQEL